MARYTGPKARINRRLGTLIYETAGAARALDRRPQPPGMHVRGRRPSNYGLALMEKQKIKHYYGLGERQLRRYFDAVGRKPGNTGELLLLMCERRLDNVVRRVGLTKTRPQARQGITHGHILVNGIKVTKPNYLLRPGDIIEVRGRENLKNLYRVSLRMQHRMLSIGLLLTVRILRRPFWVYLDQAISACRWTRTAWSNSCLASRRVILSRKDVCSSVWLQTSLNRAWLTSITQKGSHDQPDRSFLRRLDPPCHGPRRGSFPSSADAKH